MLNTFFGRFLCVLGLAVIACLQYLVWFGEGGYRDRKMLQHEIASLQTEITTVSERNRALSAEVNDLKTGLEAVEEYARLDLGLIKPNEMFIQKSTFVETVKPVATTTVDANSTATKPSTNKHHGKLVDTTMDASHTRVTPAR